MPLLGWPPDERSAPSAADTRRLAQEARDRVRFEEEALELSDQVYRVARRLVGSREEADDLVQQTYERAFRSWRQYTPGTNLRAWLLRILTNLNIDRGRRQQRTPQTTSLDNEAGDYFLYNKLESQVRRTRTRTRSACSSACQPGLDRRGARRRAARLPRRDRAGRHRRVLLRRRGADPRHPDRDRHVASPPRQAYPEEESRGRAVAA